MKLKFRSILLTSILAIAGIFGTAAVVVNNQIKEEPVVEKVEATEDLKACTAGQRFFLDTSGKTDWPSGADLVLVFYGGSKGHEGWWSNRLSGSSGGIISNLYAFTIPGDVGETWSYVAAWRLQANTDNPWNKTNKNIDALTIGTNQNVIKVTGWDDSASLGTYYGIKSKASAYVNYSWATWWNNGADTSSWQRLYFFDSFDGSADVWSEPMTVISSTGDDKILETMVPDTGTRYAGFKAVRLNRSSTDDPWNHCNNQTSNLSTLSSTDSGLLNCIKPYDDDSGYDTYHLSNSDRKGYYANYFFSNITCNQTDPYNPYPEGSWSDVQTEYDNISKEVQGEIWLTTASSGESGIEAAMYRYDYIVLYKKHSGYTDFISRSTSPNKTFSAIRTFSPFNFFGETDNNNLSTIIIIAASSVALLSITALSILVLKKRKNKEE